MRLRKLSEQKKPRDQKNLSEKKNEEIYNESEEKERYMAKERKKESNVESGEEEKRKKSLAKEVKMERKEKNFYAKTSEVKQALISKQPMIVLMYKEALLNTNQLDSLLPSIVVSLLQEF